MCDDGFTIENANVICKSLGWDGAVLYRHSSFYGDGLGSLKKICIQVISHKKLTSVSKVFLILIYSV